MKWILIVLSVLAVIGILVRRRRLFLLRKENEIRAKLDLPPLTESEFGIDPVEKSVDYRGKINQHM